MSKKTVIKADLIGKASKSEILATVAKLKGIKSMEIDAEKCTLTVVGDVDPVRIVRRLKKACLAATVVSVEDDKPKEEKKKDPVKEACEKLCKEKCAAAGACCDKCKEKCEKECTDSCEKTCNAWLGKGCRFCSYSSSSCCNGGCGPGGIISCTTTPCGAVPCSSSYPYYPTYPYYGGGGGGRPYGGGGYCYEESSPAGQCVIQ